MTQCEMIIQYMQDFGSISPMEAFIDLGIMRLSARIYQLRQSGIEISGETETALNRYGKHVYYKRYRLKKEVAHKK